MLLLLSLTCPLISVTSSFRQDATSTETDIVVTRDYKDGKLENYPQFIAIRKRPVTEYTLFQKRHDFVTCPLYMGVKNTDMVYYDYKEKFYEKARIYYNASTTNCIIIPEKLLYYTTHYYDCYCQNCDCFNWYEKNQELIDLDFLRMDPCTNNRYNNMAVFNGSLTSVSDCYSNIQDITRNVIQNHYIFVASDKNDHHGYHSCEFQWSYLDVRLFYSERNFRGY